MELILLIVAIVVILMYLVKKYMSGNDNFWPDRNVILIRTEQVGTHFEGLMGKKGMVDADLGYYKLLKPHGFGGTMEGRQPVLFLTDVNLIKQIIVKDFDHFVNRREFKLDATDPLFMKMLTCLTGQEWKDVRSLLTPTFTTGKIRRMFEHFDICGKLLADLFQKQVVQDDRGINLCESFGRFTVDVIATTAFGLNTSALTEKKSVFYQMSNRFQAMTFMRFVKVLIALFVPRVGELLRISFMDKVSMDFFTNVIRNAISHRQQSKEHRSDFLQLLLDAQTGALKDDEVDESDNFEKDAEIKSKSNPKLIKTKLTDDLIVAQCILFFAAGFDTTSSLLLFSAYALALYPDIQRKLVTEVDKTFEEFGGKLTYDAVSRMKYLDMFVSETLRMYPPAIRSERKCTKDYNLPGTDVIIPKDTLVFIPIYAVHHDETYFPNPEHFDPERFSVDNKSKIPPYAFMPFGHGPRNCIGMRFALAESKAAIAHLVSRFHVEPCAKTHIPMRFEKRSAGLKPEEGLWLKLTVRK